MSEVESVNPNVPVTNSITSSEGTLEVNSGSGPVSFDELEEITKSSKKLKAEKKSEDEVQESKQVKSKDLTSDTDKGKKAEPKEPKEAKESKPKESKEPKAEEKAEGSEADKPQRKTVKAKWQESEYDIDEEALVPVKINGKEEFVQIKDILGNYSGKVAWDKKFSELDVNRKQIAAQELKVKEISNSIKAIYDEQDPQIKMYKMAQLAGIDALEFRNKFLNENISLLEKYYSMTEDERKADALAYEASIHKHRADTLEKGVKEKEAYEALQSKVSGLRERHQISEKEFVDTYDTLEAQAKNGQIDPKLITPEYVVEAVQLNRLWGAASEKLEVLELDWNQQTKVQNLQKLVTNAHQLGLKPEDMAEMVDELWGIKKAQKKIEEKKKQNQEFTSGKKEVAQVSPKSAELWSFDQI
jgi:hypothetical protein